MRSFIIDEKEESSKPEMQRLLEIRERQLQEQSLKLLQLQVISI